jgi:hypothetical protein
MIFRDRCKPEIISNNFYPETLLRVSQKWLTADLYDYCLEQNHSET